MESLLVKALNSQENSRELQFMEMKELKEGDFLSFDDIVVKIKELHTPERKIINEVISVCKLLLVNPATSASGERSFSTARRLKTWFCSTMT